MSGDTAVEQTMMQSERRNWLFVWAVGGVLILLVQAQVRLGQIAWEALSSGEMSGAQYALCGVWVLMNGYMEGYRGFQMRFVPRVLARAHYLAVAPAHFPLALAPIYAMGHVYAAKKAKYAAWGVTCAVLIAIFFVRQLPQPWRGLVDAGVVVGLMWGTVALAIGAARRVGGWTPPGRPDLPEGAPSIGAS